MSTFRSDTTPDPHIYDELTTQGTMTTSYPEGLIAPSTATSAKNRNDCVYGVLMSRMDLLKATFCAAAAVAALALAAPLSAGAASVPAGDAQTLTPLSAGSPLATVAARRTASVRMDGCQRSLTADRSVSFTAQMTAGGPADRMEMRFDLFVRPMLGGPLRGPMRGPWKALSGVPSFGSWVRAGKGVDTFRSTKRVAGLSVGQSYRVVVSHRWLSSRGRVIKRTVSAACDQPDMHAELTGSLISRREAKGGNSLYLIEVRNSGFGAAGPFNVVLSVNGRDHSLGMSLAAQRSRLLRFVAPACSADGSTVRLSVDSGAAISELDEFNNVLELPCPPLGG